MVLAGELPVAPLHLACAMGPCGYSDQELAGSEQSLLHIEWWCDPDPTIWVVVTNVAKMVLAGELPVSPLHLAYAMGPCGYSRSFDFRCRFIRSPRISFQ